MARWIVLLFTPACCAASRNPNVAMARRVSRDSLRDVAAVAVKERLAPQRSTPLAGKAVAAMANRRPIREPQAVNLEPVDESPSLGRRSQPGHKVFGAQHDAPCAGFF